MYYLRIKILSTFTIFEKFDGKNQPIFLTRSESFDDYSPHVCKLNITYYMYITGYNSSFSLLI
jgi:hypothetical protein